MEDRALVVLHSYSRDDAKLRTHTQGRPKVANAYHQFGLTQLEAKDSCRVLSMAHVMQRLVLAKQSLQNKHRQSTANQARFPTFRVHQ